VGAGVQRRADVSFTAGVTVFSATTVSFADDVDAQQADGMITASRTIV
jgi:hypothetical protein